MVDQDCWGNLRGQLYQYWHIPDTSYRATQIWGEEPELWDFSKQQPPEIVLINLGTNDNNTANNVTNEAYVEQYTTFVEGIHAIWPKAQIILIVSSLSVLHNHADGMICSLYGMDLAPSAIALNKAALSSKRYTLSMSISTLPNISGTIFCTTTYGTQRTNPTRHVSLSFLTSILQG